MNRYQTSNNEIVAPHMIEPRYFGPAWVFASINILFGTWAIYIPTVKTNLGIDNSQLGLAIFFLSLGVFTVFPIAPPILGFLAESASLVLSFVVLLGSALLVLAATFQLGRKKN